MKRSASASPILPDLRPADVLFINAYLSNNFNGTHAYKSIHPRASLESCRAAAPRLLARPQIKAELARRLQADTKITIELIEQDLLTARELALSQGNPQVIASVAMDQAKLKGYLVEKREVRDTTTDSAPVIRDLVHSAMRQASVSNG